MNVVRFLFEESWDMENPALSAMAHAALALIHKSNGDTEKYETQINRLDRFGGWESVDPSWLDVINTDYMEMQFLILVNNRLFSMHTKQGLINYYE